MQEKERLWVTRTAAMRKYMTAQNIASIDDLVYRISRTKNPKEYSELKDLWTKISENYKSTGCIPEPMPLGATRYVSKIEEDCHAGHFKGYETSSIWLKSIIQHTEGDKVNKVFVGNEVQEKAQFYLKCMINFDFGTDEVWASCYKQGVQDAIKEYVKGYSDSSFRKNDFETKTELVSQIQKDYDDKYADYLGKTIPPSKCTKFKTNSKFSCGKGNYCTRGKPYCMPIKTSSVYGQCADVGAKTFDTLMYGTDTLLWTRYNDITSKFNYSEISYNCRDFGAGNFKNFGSHHYNAINAIFKNLK